jgi:uncharacterized protein
MIRGKYLDQIDFQFSIHSVCGLIGPRQVGKTTLSKEYAKKFDKVHFFDLEDPLQLAVLDNPMLVFSQLDADLIVIDEIQRRPELFPVIRVLVDQKPYKFLVLGSASRDLLQQSSETLAGRIGYIELKPFLIPEVDNAQTLWLRGGFPRSYLAQNEEKSYVWRQDYIQTFMERDIPNLGFSIPPAHIQRVWMMLAHNHSNILNSSEIGTNLAISHHTVKRYVDILSGTFMIRTLFPWFENIAKRQVKLPKIYVRDSGILHTLLGIKTNNALIMHPKMGASWEGFAIEAITNQLQIRNEECFFWATHSGAELDLLVFRAGKRIGFEIKYTDAPKITKSARIAIEDLTLDHLYIIFPGNQSFPMDKNITAAGLESRLLQELAHE